MKQNKMILLMIASLMGMALRFWAMFTAANAGGLPVADHASTYLSILLSLLVTGVFLFFSHSSPGRSGKKDILNYSAGQFSQAMLGAVLILFGAVVEFMETILYRPSTASLVMCLMGFVAGLCLMLVAYARKTGTHRYPAAHLFPVVYLTIKLIFNFKDWSTDPIILDYCFVLFGLIFALLAFYHTAGFYFNKGKPRKSLFFCLVAVFFSAMAAAEGLGGGSNSTFVTYLGVMFWCIPMIPALYAPAEPEITTND